MSQETGLSKVEQWFQARLSYAPDSIRGFRRMLKEPSEQRNEYIESLDVLVDTFNTIGPNDEYMEAFPAIGRLKEQLGDERLPRPSALLRVARMENEFPGYFQKHAMEKGFNRIDTLIYKRNGDRETRYPLRSIELVQPENGGYFDIKSYNNVLYVGSMMHVYEQSVMDVHRTKVFDHEIVLDALMDTIALRTAFGKDEKLPEQLIPLLRGPWDGIHGGVGWVDEERMKEAVNQIDSRFYETTLPPEERMNNSIIMNDAETVQSPSGEVTLKTLFMQNREKLTRINWNVFDEIIAARSVHPKQFTPDDPFYSLYLRRLQTIRLTIAQHERSSGSVAEEVAKDFIRWWQQDFQPHHFPQSPYFEVIFPSK